jgi:sucrose phosphorylase
VYYVGLLAGLNDMDLLAKTGAGRDINRQYFSPEQIHAALAQDVVQQLLRLIRLRNSHPAFNGSFTCSAEHDAGLTLTWRQADGRGDGHGDRNAECHASLRVDFQALTAVLTWTGEHGLETWRLHALP